MHRAKVEERVSNEHNTPTPTAVSRPLPGLLAEIKACSAIHHPFPTSPSLPQSLPLPFPSFPPSTQPPLVHRTNALPSLLLSFLHSFIPPQRQYAENAKIYSCCLEPKSFHSGLITEGVMVTDWRMYHFSQQEKRTVNYAGVMNKMIIHFGAGVAWNTVAS